MANPSNLRLGILVPSSNTAVERVLISMLAPLAPNITVHFARVSVTKLTLDPGAASQFSDHERFTAAAKLLRDAEVDVISWAGTSGGWMGFEQDEALARAIGEATGIPATTSTMALNRALERLQAKKIGFVTPYLDDVHARILSVYRAGGYDVVSDDHLGLSSNAKIGALNKEQLSAQVGVVVRQGGPGLEAVTTFCTNLNAAHLVPSWEAEYDITVVDSVAVIAWDMLKIKGWDCTRLSDWGKIFTV